jgi:hypothetical protein
MAQNEFHVDQLRECIRRQRVHEELLRVVYGRASHLISSHYLPPPLPMDPRLVLRARRDALTTADLLSYSGRLRCWVSTLWQTRSEASTPRDQRRTPHGGARSDAASAAAAPSQSERIAAANPTYNRSLRDSSITAAVLRDQLKSRQRRAGSASRGTRQSSVGRPTGSRRPRADANDAGSWDAAYAEAVKQQQLLLSELNAELEMLVARLAATCRERQQFDPQGTISQLRELAQSVDHERKEQQVQASAQHRARLAELQGSECNGRPAQPTKTLARSTDKHAPLRPLRTGHGEQLGSQAAQYEHVSDR